MTEKRVDAVLQRMKYFFKEREWIKKKRTILIITALAAVAVFFVSFLVNCETTVKKKETEVRL
jgi:hypothetical protein